MPVSLKLHPARRSCLAVLVFPCAFLFHGKVAGGEVPFPAGVAFNRGNLTRKALDEAVTRKVAEEVKWNPNQTVVRHLHLEVFENNKLASKAQTTLFAVCESTFSATLNSGRILTHLRVEYVILDYAGKPVGKQTVRLEYKDGLNKEKKLVWTVAETEATDLDKFHKSLPAWAKDKLWQTSGFLSLNPGQQPVAFRKTEEELAVSLLGEILDLAPGLAKKALAGILENALKKLSKDALTEAVKQKDVRWGAGSDLNNEKAIRNATAYREEGRKLWTE